MSISNSSTWGQLQRTGRSHEVASSVLLPQEPCDGQRRGANRSVLAILAPGVNNRELVVLTKWPPLSFPSFFSASSSSSAAFEQKCDCSSLVSLPSDFLSVSVIVCLSVCLSVYVCLPACLSVCLVCLSAHPASSSSSLSLSLHHKLKRSN